MKKKLFDNKWAVRLLSLVFAVFLYLFVASENNAFSFQSAANQQFASINITETISNVPVSVGEIREDAFISGLPESVQVRLTGPRNVINQVMETNLVVETENLLEAESGSQYIRLIIDNLPESVDYQITPSQVYVKLSQLETITAPIAYEFGDEAIAEGFEAVNVTLSPNEVELVGDAETISDIERVFIMISSAFPANGDFNGTYHLQIVNSEGENLDVNSSVSEIEVEIEVLPQQREVGLHVIPFGENQADYSYEYTIISPQSLVIQGEYSQLNSLNTVGVRVNVQELTESAVINGQLNLPAGIESAGVGEVLVEVQVIPINDSDRSSNNETETPDNMDEEASDESISDTVEDEDDSDETDEPTDGLGNQIDSDPNTVIDADNNANN